MSFVSRVGDTLADTTERRLLRVGEAAEALSVSRWTIYRWVEDGRLRGTQLGKGSLRIFRESITGLIQRNEIAMPGTLSNAKRL
jgi:excisionase family DNA binding protein